MKRYIKFSFVLLGLLIVMSCVTTTIVPPQPIYEKNSIRFNIFPDSRLNFHKGNPHTLHVFIYQLKEPNAFNQLSGDEAGLYKLLEGESFDSSVTSFDKIVVRPGQTVIETFDRSEGAKYVGIAAGFYAFDVPNMTRLFKIPVVEEKKGWYKVTITKHLAPLNVDLRLGPTGIESAEVK